MRRHRARGGAAQPGAPDEAARPRSERQTVTPRTWRRTLTALAAALAALLPASAASAQPGELPLGGVVLTDHAYATYLIPDDGVGNNGTYLQVYYRHDHPFPRTFEFEPLPGHAGLYRWKSARTGTCAEATDNHWSSVGLRTCADAKKAQWWRVRHVRGTDDQWVLSPYLNERLAVTALSGDDNWAPLRELPSLGTATAAQKWHIDPA